MPLTDAWIRAAKPRDKVYKQSDAGGLYIEITTAGKKIWRLAYRCAEKQKALSLGSYPLIGLSQAREARDEAKRTLLRGIDPAEVRKAATVASENTFEAIAREWHAWKAKGLSPRYAS